MVGAGSLVQTNGAVHAGAAKVDLGFREADKIAGEGAHDEPALADEVGGPVDHVLAALRVVDYVGSPGHAGVGGGDLRQARGGPVDQVVRLPDDDVVRALGGVVVADVPATRVHPEIGGDDPEGRAVLGSDDGRVAHAGLAHIADQDGGAAVDGRPGTGVVVVAHGEVDLFAIRRVLTGELCSTRPEISACIE